MKRALILVDIQNDFLPGGALAVPGGEEVIPVANKLIQSGTFDLVVATQDFHPAGHKSFASSHAGRSVGERIDLNGLEQILWPDHCVQGTSGAELSSELHLEGVHHAVFKGQDAEIDSYSGFYDNGRRAATTLAETLQQEEITDVYVAGLATDYCVKFTALDSAGHGFATWLIEDACRGVNLQPDDVDRAIADMKANGITVVTSDALNPE